MNKAMIFNFEVDKENKKIRVMRSFDAPLALVWSAWTEAELLDHWWAPKPWKTETQSMDFTEGGRWVYAMVGPEGERHHAFMDYQSIAPKKTFTAREGFADQDGKANEAMPVSTWVNTFSEKDGAVSVTNDIAFSDLAQLETLIQMGFKEGYTMGLDQLEELLASLAKKRK
jgi:PhnB protein